MGPREGLTDSIWDDMDRALGQLLMVGWEGTTVTPQIKTLISEHHVGSILLSAKNLKSAEHTTQLVLELQRCAFQAGHPVPLTIGIDQENGGVNSLFDEVYIRQFPSAMGLAATGSRDLAYEVAKATAEEISACGINLILGPCLDVLTNARNQPLGVRTPGDDPKEVSAFGVACIKGYSDAGLATVGKHFPSYGSLEFLGSALDIPTITESLESLSLNALVPFRNAIRAGLHAMLVGGCAMSSTDLNVMHACLSDQVVNDLLRKELNFQGVVISDCLEMEALSQNIGVRGGTVMAINAGCDIVLLCRSFSHQQEAVEGLKLGLENGIITPTQIKASLDRILTLKAKSTSWDCALNPPGVRLLSTLQPLHTKLSTKAYNSSITVLRDKNHYLPLSNMKDFDDELLLLTPLVKPLAASAASRALSESATNGHADAADWERSASVMSGERVFRELGRLLARQRSGRVMHTSYTATGVRPQHENLIERAKTIIVVTADANRNLYQLGFTKHVSMICNSQYDSRGERREKPIIVVAVSSPYDFALDQSIGTYVCTYDFTETALTSLVRVLFAELDPTGVLPGTISQSQKLSLSKQHWLVEAFNEERDANALDALIKAVVDDQTSGLASELIGATSNTFLLRNPEVLESHFMVRNSNTHALYGFCTTYYFRLTRVGVIGPIIVDPSRRKLSIGHSLHNRAIRTLLQREGIQKFQLGSRLPGLCPGIPNITRLGGVKTWFANLGWKTSPSRTVCSMLLKALTSWTSPAGIVKSLQTLTINFDYVYGWEHSSPVLAFVSTSNEAGVPEIYRMALGDAASCSVIRATRRKDGELIGTVVLYNALAKVGRHMPQLSTFGNSCGAMLSPLVTASATENQLLLQGLLLLGLRRLKQQGCNACVLYNLDIEGGKSEAIEMLGFEPLRTFEQIRTEAAVWTRMPPSRD